MKEADPEVSLILGEILTPAAFPHPVSRLEFHETHISWIILTGPFAYKIKKNVHFDFIDTTTIAQRQHLCEEEVRLNRRIAPDLYLGVVAIARDKDGLHFAGAGPVVEYAVKMKQFDPSQELLSLLSRREVTLGEIADLGERIARFHAEAARALGRKEFLHTEHLCTAVLANLEYFSLRPNFSDNSELTRLIKWSRERLQHFSEEFHKREQSGLIRECHGDLHARNIVRWQGQLTPFDCLEFDPDLRWIDVMSDVAFLAMDLVDRKRGDLAFAFLNRYLEMTGDYAGLTLLAFYAVYRALVRAKIDAISAEQQPALGDEYRERLHSRLRAALEFISPAPPTLFIMHGPSGSGKSWLSERLVPRLPAIRMRSDFERKRLAGVAALEHRDETFQRGIYTPESTHRTYTHLLDCAEACLRGGMNAILDAAFLNAGEREMFRALATNLNLRFIVLSCQAEPAILADRIACRSRTNADPSDAGIAVLNRQLQNMKPLSATEYSQVIQVNTHSTEAVTFVLDAIRQSILR